MTLYTKRFKRRLKINHLKLWNKNGMKVLKMNLSTENQLKELVNC